jgi:hypothetical protein
MQIGKPGEESRTEDGGENENEIVRRIDRLYNRK